MNVSQLNYSMKYCLGLDPFNRQQINTIVNNCIGTFFKQTISTSEYQIDFDSIKNQITIVFYNKATLILENSNNSSLFLSYLYSEFQKNSIKVMAFLT